MGRWCLCISAWESEQEHVWEPTLIENRARLNPGVTNTALLTLSSPQSDKAGTNWRTLLDTYQCAMLIIHTSDPAASLLLPYTMMRFVSDFVSRRDWVAPDPCLGLGSSEAGGDITDSIHSPALGKSRVVYPVSRDHSHFICRCLGGRIEGAICHLSSTRWNMTNLINLC